MYQFLQPDRVVRSEAMTEKIIVTLKLLSMMFLLSFAFAALAEDPVCFQNQFVMTVIATPALQERALDALNEFVDEDLTITNSTKKTILVAPENQDAADGAEVTPYDEAADPCIKLRAQKRASLRALKLEKRQALVRRYSCSCNARLKLQALPNDEFFPLMWGLSQPNDIDINMPEAWDISTGSNKTVVAVIDTGVDYNHSDLSANMWTNSLEIPSNGIDDDNNGFVDDFYGAEMVTNSGNPLDDQGHGTHVAGTIGASGDNTIGVTGINWQVRIMALKFLSSTGAGTLFDAIKALDYVTAMKQRGENIVATNNSWGGGGFSQPLAEAIERSNNAGVLFVAATGNSAIDMDASPQYPASYASDNVISVAAIDKDGNLAPFSNYGAKSAHIAAPGDGIASTYLGNQYVYLSGTSMAAPHVTGTLALLKSFAPDISSAALKTVLLRTGKALTSLTSSTVTGSLVDAAAALSDIRDHGAGATPVPKPIFKVTGKIVGKNGKALTKVQIKKLKITPLQVVAKSSLSQEKSFAVVSSKASWSISLPEGNYSLSVQTEGSKSKTISGKGVELILKKQMTGFKLAVRI